MKTRRVVLERCLIVLVLASLSLVALADKQPEVSLTKTGEKLRAKYAERLATLKNAVIPSVPAIDEGKKRTFMDARKLWNSMSQPGKDSTAAEREAYSKIKPLAESNTINSARTILPDIEGFLGSDKLDEKLMEIAILTDATSVGLAEFAQQGKEEEQLLEGLFSDKALMKQMLVAGGANSGEWGEAMQVYAAIQEKSKHAREKDSILQRLALGTALQQPLLKGKEAGGRYGIGHADSACPDGPVSRYLHYEKAYLNGELDAALTNMNAWECRFIGNDPYTNEELRWTREMLRNYRPDHIINPDYKWRYARMVKSDVPYKSPDWRPDEGTTKVQQIVAGGGKCGPRAFFGRTVCRAFGIPSRRSTQTGHAAMNHWTPDGWVVCFGAWWSWNRAGPWTGLDFYLESQAREFPEEFMQVLRAQWIGDALDEEDVSISAYGKGGGLWNSLAFHKKTVVVADHQATIKAAALQAELAAMSAEEATAQLGETDVAPDEVEVNPMIELRPEDKKIVVAEDGTITVPVAACTKPTNNTERILFMESHGGKGAQVHYTRLGKRPDLLKYYVEAPKAGKYKLIMHVCTVAREQKCLLRLNRRTLIDVDLPTSWGMWEDTKPIEIDLKEGRNTFMFTCKAPHRGVSMKSFKLTPLK